MRKNLFLSLCLGAMASVSSCSDGFDRRFTGETLRVDYYAVGTRADEAAELISMTRTGAWAGPRANLVNPYDLGDYLKRQGQRGHSLSGRLLHAVRGMAHDGRGNHGDGTLLQQQICPDATP